MDDGNLSRPSFSNPDRRPAPRRAPDGVQRAARAVAGALVSLWPVVTANGSRGRHARPTGFTRFTDRMAAVVRHESRWVFGGVVAGGSVLSILVGMTIGGAFSGVDVALAPKSPAPAGPRIEYAAPAQGSHSSHSSSHSTSHPASKAAGSGQGNAGNAAAPATTAPSTDPTSTPASAPSTTPPSSPSTVPTTTPTTPPSTPSTPTTTVPSKPKPKPNPIQQLLGG